MAFADFAGFYTALANNKIDQALVGTAASNVIVGRLVDLYRNFYTANGVAAIPSTATACSKATDGALNFQVPNAAAGRLMLVGAEFNSLATGTYILIDRLSHQGGLSATTTGAQTTNLPTAALTRYTTGDGVMIGVTIHTAIGATATTITASYTNQAGTSGRTTPLVTFGGTNFNAALRMVLLPLASGDTGVRAVASVTLAASTLTAGNFGVTLFKPLGLLSLESSSNQQVLDLFTGNFIGGLPEILGDACLNLLYIPVPLTTNPVLTARLSFVEN